MDQVTIVLLLCHKGKALEYSKRDPYSIIYSSGVATPGSTMARAQALVKFVYARLVKLLNSQA